jgi:hypothetical protein
MNERDERELSGMTDEQQRELEQQRRDRESIDLGTGLGAGVSPVLPTDVDGHTPDSRWMSTTNEEVAEPNWAHAEEVEPGLQRLDAQHEPLKLSKDTHIVSVFGEDIGRIEGVYGYAPTNEPVWASVKEGDRHLMVPVMSGQMEDDGLHVPYPKNIIETAPPLGEGIQAEMALYSHYNERRMLPATDGYTQDSERTMHPVSIAA